MPEQTKYYRRDRGRDLRRRKPGSPRKRFEVDTIHRIHREIINRLALGQKNSVIARALGVSEVMVSYTKNSSKIQDEVDVVSGNRDAHVMDVRKEIRDLLPRAFTNLKSIITNGTVNGADVSTALMAKESNNMLDRDLGKPTQHVEGKHAHALFTLQDIEDIKQRALKAGGVVDVTPL